MKNITKRILALVLSFVMVVTSLPVIAEAANAKELKEYDTYGYNSYTEVKPGDSIDLMYSSSFYGRYVYNNVKTSGVKGDKKNWTLSKVGSQFEYKDKTIEYGQSNIPNKIKETAEAGMYILTYKGNIAGFVNRQWRFEIKKAPTPQPKVKVTYTLVTDPDGLAVGKDTIEFNKAKDIEKNEYDNISTDVKDYVVTTYTKDDFIYTLKENESKVEKVEKKPAFGNTNSYEVKVTAKYDKKAVQYYQTINVESDKAELTASEIVLDGITFGTKVECDKNARLGKVKDYVKATYTKGDDTYTLINGEDDVKAGRYDANNERTATVNARYNKESKVTVTINHRLKFLWNNVDELANDENAIFKTVPEKLSKAEKADLENNVGKYLDDKYIYNGDCKLEGNVLTINYETVKVTVEKEIKPGDKTSVTKYFNRKDLKCAPEYTFDKMTNEEIKDLYKDLIDETTIGKDGKVYRLKEVKIEKNGTVAIIKCTYAVAKYTVIFKNVDDKELGRADVEYGKDANSKANELAKKVPGFKGWVDEEGKEAKLTNITKDMVVKASQESKIKLKHVLEFYNEIFEDIKSEMVFRKNAVEGYLQYALKEPKYKNPSILKATDEEVTIKYWATLVRAKYVDKDGNEIANALQKLIPSETLGMLPPDKYAYAQSKTGKPVEKIEDKENYATYTLNKQATKVGFARYENAPVFDQCTVINIEYVYDVVFVQDTYTVTYVTTDAYDKESKSQPLSFSFDKKDREAASKLEANIVENIPNGYVEDKEKARTNGETEKDIIVYIKSDSTEVADEVKYSVRVGWNINGYKVLSDSQIWKDMSPKGSIEYNTKSGEITKYINNGWTLDGLTINNETMTWSTHRFDATTKLYHSGNVNGLYDADKDGIVEAEYIVKLRDGETTKYGDGQVKFFNNQKAGNFEELILPEEVELEDDNYEIRWKYITMETKEGKYTVYGQQLNLPKTIDEDAEVVEYEYKLPQGISAIRKDSFDILFGSDLSEKLAEKVNDIEADWVKADTEDGAMVATLDEGDVYELLDKASFEEDGEFYYMSFGSVQTNYDKYAFEVRVAKRGALTGEKFTLNKTNKATAQKQAESNAKNAAKDKAYNIDGLQNAFFEVLSVEGFKSEGSQSAGTYPLTVVLSSVDDSASKTGVEFTVNVDFEATWNGKNRKPAKPSNKTEEFVDPNRLEASGALTALREDRPNDSLTRSEFVGVLAEIFKVMDTQQYKDFQDLDLDANKTQILQYSSFEIVKGYCETEFGPQDFITREQMYAIIARALKFSGKATAFTDEQIDAAIAKVLDSVNVSDWAKVDVCVAIEDGLFTAEEKPLDTIKRVEAADKLEEFIAILYTEGEAVELQ